MWWIILLSVFLLIAALSYYYSWNESQRISNQVTEIMQKIDVDYFDFIELHLKKSPSHDNSGIDTMQAERLISEAMVQIEPQIQALEVLLNSVHISSPVLTIRSEVFSSVIPILEQYLRLHNKQALVNADSTVPALRKVLESSMRSDIDARIYLLG